MSDFFGERLAQAVRRTNTCAVVGLDPHLDRLPQPLKARFEGREGHAFRAEAARAVVEFNRMVIDAVASVVPAIKPQFAFYEALGAPGFAALEETCGMARDAGLLIVGDAKRGDIASTAAAYAQSILSPDGPFHCDAVTVNPWMGADTLDPFLDACASTGGGLFVLVRTTNPGSRWLQHHGQPNAAERVARELEEKGRAFTGPSGWSSVGAVVGAMAGDEAGTLRECMPAAWFLVPGVGAQGGSTSDALAGQQSDGMGCLVNSSRGVLYPSDGAKERYNEAPQNFISEMAITHAERFQLDVEGPTV